MLSKVVHIIRILEEENGKIVMEISTEQCEKMEDCSVEANVPHIE